MTDIITRLRALQMNSADEAAHLILRLTFERDAAREKIERIMAGLEGCCMTCEPVGLRNQQMDRDIATLKAERDEARRQVCWLLRSWVKTEKVVALERGWDCYEKETK